jgi:hypothetical protein
MNEKDEDDFPYESLEQNPLVPSVHDDPIASGYHLDANKPVMDVRKYGLRVVESQIDRALKSWNNTVGHLKTPFKTYVRYCSST